MSLNRPSLKFLLPGLVGVLLAVWGGVAQAGRYNDRPPEEICASLPPAKAKVVAEWARPAQEIKPLARPEGNTAVSVGIKYKIKLLPVEEVALVMPEKGIHLDKFGGLLSFTVTKAGPYRFSTAPYVWLELVPADGSKKETDVLGSEALLWCAGIKKNVVFDLEATRYWLQMSGTLEQDVEVMVSAPE